MIKYCQTDFLLSNGTFQFSDNLSRFGLSLFQAIKDQLKGNLAPYWNYLRYKTDKDIFIVGGALRNLAWGKSVKDWDLIIDCEQSAEVCLFSRQFCDFAEASWVVLDEERGFYRAVFNHHNIEIDFCTRQGKNIEQDLQERDFTINALAYSLKSDLLYDIGGGLSDLWCRRLVSVSSHSLEGDPLRALRAIRFCLAYSLASEKKLDDKITAFLSSGLTEIAGERLAAELAAILELPLALCRVRLQNWALDIFLQQNWEARRTFWDVEFSLWKMLVCLEKQQTCGWPLFKHSGRLLQIKLNQSPRGGRSYFTLLKLALLTEPDLLSEKNNRFKLSGAELQVIKETNQAAELAKLLTDPVDRREYYHFFCRIKYFFVAAAVNGICLSSIFEVNFAEGRLSSRVDSVGYTYQTFYLDCLLFDYFKGGTLSRPIVPVDGHLLQKKLGIKPGPELGKILRELAAECSQRGMSEEEALCWVKDRLSQEGPF